MANSGYDWGAFAFMQKGAGDWSADALADAATETGDETSLDVKAACEVGIALNEDNTGAITGDVTVHVLGAVDTTPNFEEPAQAINWRFNVTPIQNDIVYLKFPIDPAKYGSFKLAIENNSGQELAVTVYFRTADWPVAS